MASTPPPETQSEGVGAVWAYRLWGAFGCIHIPTVARKRALDTLALALVHSHTHPQKRQGGQRMGIHVSAAAPRRRVATIPSLVSWQKRQRSQGNALTARRSPPPGD